jgi:hypothetical protein
MDLISGLPLTPTDFNAIKTVIDRLTKLVTLIPCVMTILGRRVAQLLMEKVFCRFGFPGDSVPDRDTRFTNGFYRELCSRLGIHQSMSTAWHPKSDGNTMVVNKVVATTIRAHINNMQTNWSELLCMVKFAINNSKHSSTKDTPFFMTFGRHPLTPFARTVLPLKELGLDMPSVEGIFIFTNGRGLGECIVKFNKGKRPFQIICGCRKKGENL